MIWGLEIRELCHQLTQAYEKVVNFKKNRFTIPANKVGKQFLAFMAQSLEWAAKEDIEEHLSWFANVILAPICLQMKDKKSTAKQKTEQLKLNLEIIGNGRIEDVIREACTIQNKLAKKKRSQKKTRKPNWISMVGIKVKFGDLNCASRILDEKNKGVEAPSDQTFQRMSALFHRRKDKDMVLPVPDVTATRLTHSSHPA